MRQFLINLGLLIHSAIKGIMNIVMLIAIGIIIRMFVDGTSFDYASVYITVLGFSLAQSIVTFMMSGLAGKRLETMIIQFVTFTGLIVFGSVIYRYTAQIDNTGENLYIVSFYFLAPLGGYVFLIRPLIDLILPRWIMKWYLEDPDDFIVYKDIIDYDEDGDKLWTVKQFVCRYKLLRKFIVNELDDDTVYISVKK